jgi:hypothetical protein
MRRKGASFCERTFLVTTTHRPSARAMHREAVYNLV